jgi:hypothetical protein
VLWFIGVKRPVRLRSYLIALVVAVLLPVVVLAAYLAIASAARERQAIERGMRETATALSLAIDGQVATAIASIEALSASTSFRKGEGARLSRLDHVVTFRVVNGRGGTCQRN